MRYIGCKRRLLPFIHQTMRDFNIDGQIFCDLFAGTATVGQYFKAQGYQIISCDLLYCSFIQQWVKIKLNQYPKFYKLIDHLHLNEPYHPQTIIDYLNVLPSVEGFIYHNYSHGGTENQPLKRLYFSDENAKKIDSIREMLMEWKCHHLINNDEFYLLLYALLDSASNHDNTTGQQSGFLKQLNRKSQQTLHLTLPSITPSGHEHHIYCQSNLSLINELPAVDILYLDPPYTRKQYSTAYHLLETIARWDKPPLRGITGLRPTEQLNSPFCSKPVALAALKYLLCSGNYRHLLLSYSEDGLLSHDEMTDLLEQYGEVSVAEHCLPRYQTKAHIGKNLVKERLYYLKPYAALSLCAGAPVIQRGVQR